MECDQVELNATMIKSEREKRATKIVIYRCLSFFRWSSQLTSLIIVAYISSAEWQWLKLLRITKQTHLTVSMRSSCGCCLIRSWLFICAHTWSTIWLSVCHPLIAHMHVPFVYVHRSEWYFRSTAHCFFFYVIIMIFAFRVCIEWFGIHFSPIRFQFRRTKNVSQKQANLRIYCCRQGRRISKTRN